MSRRNRILYVDDEELNLELFSIIFQDDYDIITASSASGGLRHLSEKHDIELVISDMKMPGMSGIEFIAQARQQYRNIHYFILTGFEITDEISNALDSNLIDRYLTKPIDENEIRQAIQDVL